MTRKHLFRHVDQHDDSLTVTRITEVAAGDGVTVATTSRHGYQQAVVLPDLETVAMLTVVAEALGYELTVAGETHELCNEAWRPMAQRILDGEFGQEAAAAVTHLLLALADARGERDALRQEFARWEQAQRPRLVGQGTQSPEGDLLPEVPDETG